MFASSRQMNMRQDTRYSNNNNNNSNSTVETINAAATAIASVDNNSYNSRVNPQASVQKRRWRSFWSISSCFGCQKNKKRIGHAVLVPEPSGPVDNVPASQMSTQASTRTLPFVAPPSSPASFLQSEPPSAIQSPAGLVPINSVSANMYSPGGPASMFAIGPYAHETQLVSPPVFSTYTTEPSTAPFTPPPESVHLTTPSSPEVPIAQLLDLNIRNGEANQKFLSGHYDFHSYQLQPGSPVGQLISPSSGISGSGTSSPFPDRDFAVTGSQFLEFWKAERPKLFNLGRMPTYDWCSRQGSGTLTPNAVRAKCHDDFPLDHPPNLLNPEELPVNKRESRQSSGTLTPNAVRPNSNNDFPLDHPPNLLDLEKPASSELESKRVSDALPSNAVKPGARDIFPRGYQYSRVASHENIANGCHGDQLVDHRVSFELTVEDVARCVEKKPVTSSQAVSTSVKDASDLERKENSGVIANDNGCSVGKTSDETPEPGPPAASEDSGQRQNHRSITLGSGKDFNFDNADGADSHRLSVGSDWWANEKVVGKENESVKSWSFFPVMQPGVS